MLHAVSRILCAVVGATFIGWIARADAAVVTGTYTTRGGAPLASRQLHFENRISGDIYLTRTGSDGSFSSDLPPGLYDLRAERGLVVKAGIRVDGPPLEVGRVNDGAPLDVRRPFEREGIGPTLMETEAPATAHLEKQALASGPSSAPSPAVPATSDPAAH